MSELPTPNLPLLRKVLDHIDAHPDQWNQNLFFATDTASSCGTVCCVAGWTAKLTSDLWVEGEELSSGEHVEVYAKRELGLGRDEARDLFWNTIYVDMQTDSEMASKSEQRANVQAVAEAIAARAGERL